ncbi:MAG: coiled-coil domain-containing protein [Byssovorax sp.]
MSGPGAAHADEPHSQPPLAHYYFRLDYRVAPGLRGCLSRADVRELLAGQLDYDAIHQDEGPGQIVLDLSRHARDPAPFPCHDARHAGHPAPSAPQDPRPPPSPALTASRALALRSLPEPLDPVFLRTMAVAPRTIAALDPFDVVEGFLEHLFVNLRACDLTQSLAPTVDQLLTDLAHHRTTRAQLARIVFALKARQIFHDDDLNRVLDDAKAALSADTSDAGVELYKDIFENKRPAETRKYVLGQQLTTMTFWPGKMAASPRPEVQAIGVQAKQVTDNATALLNDIGAAETALAQFDTGPRVTFVDACNAAVKLIFGQLSEMEHAPPAPHKGPLPDGFVDRFFLRDGSGKARSIKEQEEAVSQTRSKLARQEGQLKELKDKQSRDQAEKLGRELKEKEDQMNTAQTNLDKNAAEVARLKAEIEKNKTPPDER